MRDLCSVINENLNKSLFDELLKYLKANHTTNNDSTRQLCNAYSLSELQFTLSRRHDDVINLDMIRSRKTGSGTLFMKDLCTYADENNITLTLSPTDKFVGSNNLNRLVDFYRRFGFDDVDKKKLRMLHVKMIRIPQ